MVGSPIVELLPLASRQYFDCLRTIFTVEMFPVVAKVTSEYSKEYIILGGGSAIDGGDIICLESKERVMLTFLDISPNDYSVVNIQIAMVISFTKFVVSLCYYIGDISDSTGRGARLVLRLRVSVRKS